MKTRMKKNRGSDYLVVGDEFNGLEVVELSPEIATCKKRNGRTLPMPRIIIDTLINISLEHPRWDVRKTNADDLKKKGTLLEPYFISGYGPIHHRIIETVRERIREEAS